MGNFFQSLIDWLTEEPSVEQIIQPEDPTLEAKRRQARTYLAQFSPKWRDRRIKYATKDPRRANEGSAS